MDAAGGQRPLRCRELGQGLLLGRAKTATSGCTPRRIRPGPSISRNWSIRSSCAASTCPILIRFADILKHRLGELHSAFATAIAEHHYQGDYCCVYPIKVNQQRQVVEEVLEFGTPLPLRAGSRLQARADGRDGHGRQRNADHLQRLQGRRIHRDGHAGPEGGPQDHPGGREVHRAAADPEVQPAGGRAARHRPAREAGQPRLGPLEVVRRLPLQIRPLRHRGHARPAGAERPGHGGLPQPAALPPGQPDHQHPPDQGRGERSRARLRGPGARRRRPADTWTSAAAWASTTTAPRPISNPASTTPCRNTPTTSSTTCRTCATKSAWRTPPSSPRADAPSPPITACWCSTSWACPEWARPTCRAEPPAGRRAAADRPAGNLPRPDRQEPARKLPRRPAGARPGAQPVQPGLPLARTALHRREPLLGDLPPHPEAGARAGLLPRGAGRHRRHALRHLFLQLLAVPEHARQLGHQAALPHHADPPAGRGAHAPRRAGRHHLRFRRQGGRLHRPPRREAHAAAAPLRRRRLLPGRVPAGRLPGDPGRPAQSVRRYQRRPRAPRARPARSCSIR